MKIKTIVVVGTVSAFTSWIATENHYEMHHRKGMQYARETMPRILKNEHVVPSTTELAFVGDSSDVRTGRLLYLVGMHPDEEDKWERLGWGKLSERFSKDELIFRMRMIKDMNCTNSCRVFIRKRIEKTMFFEQTLLVCPEFSALLIVLPR